jgi:hypothetical protein
MSIYVKYILFVNKVLNIEKYLFIYLYINTISINFKEKTETFNP